MVSIIIPFIRADGAERCVQHIKQNAGVPESEYEIIAAQDFDRIGCPEMVDALQKKSKGDLVMFLGDDTRPEPDFLKNALAAMTTLPDGWGMVGLNDHFFKTGNNATHWLIDKRMLPIVGGQFFHTGYHHCFCDNELTERARAAGRYLWAENAGIIHDNPLCRGEKPTGEYARIYDPEIYQHDMELFRKRMRWGKVAVAARIGRDVDPAFYISMMNLQAKGLLPGDTILPPSVGIPHAPACNVLVQRFLKTDCDSILFVDDDMSFDHDALLKLRMQGFDYGILSGLTVSRRHPFWPVCVQKIDGRMVVPKINKTGITDSNYLGLAFTLIRREIIEKMQANGRKLVFEWTNEHGEDGSFCLLAHEMGYKLGVCADVDIGHRITFTGRWDAEHEKGVMTDDDFGIEQLNKPEGV